MNTHKWIYIILAGSLFLFSCVDYLEKTPESDVTEKDIFGNFRDFQGFIEFLYTEIPCFSSQALSQSMNLAGETTGRAFASDARHANFGLHEALYRRSGSNLTQTLFHYLGRGGIWTGGWKAIRAANMALENLPLMVNATTEEKNLIAGQAYFFRAYYHWNIIRFVGGMPYIDHLLGPQEELNFPRLTYRESTEKVVEDFDRAIELLPIDWDQTAVGGATPGANAGRVTKGAALALKAKALLYAGSPLISKDAGEGLVYNLSYMQRAAEAAWEVIKLANNGVYALVPWSNYQDMFATKDGTSVFTTETILIRTDNTSATYGSGLMSARHGRLYSPPRFGGNQVTETVNQLWIDRFEMADGTRYKLEYDNDNTLRWDFRDPRFRQNILVDRDQHGYADVTKVNFFIGVGTERTAANGFSSPYIVKKYWPIGVNTYDRDWSAFRYRTPDIRLADVYLIYAEAVNEAYGANGTHPGANLTALDAVNLIRNRAGMPSATADAPGYNSFAELIQNERWAELCFEGNAYFDMRRWYIAHLPENKPFVDLQFNRDWTTFTRVTIFTRIFDDPKHYWFPLPVPQTQIYRDLWQNPGW